MQIFENALGKRVAGLLPPPAAPALLAHPVHGVGDFCIAEGYVQKEFMKKILGSQRLSPFPLFASRGPVRFAQTPTF